MSTSQCTLTRACQVLEPCTNPCLLGKGELKSWNVWWERNVEFCSQLIPHQMCGCGHLFQKCVRGNCYHYGGPVMYFCLWLFMHHGVFSGGGGIFIYSVNKFLKLHERKPEKQMQLSIDVVFWLIGVEFFEFQFDIYVSIASFAYNLFTSHPCGVTTPLSKGACKLRSVSGKVVM